MAKYYFFALASVSLILCCVVVIKENLLPNYTPLAATGNTTIIATGHITTIKTAETEACQNDTSSLLKSMTECSLRMGIPPRRIRNGLILKVSQKANRLLREMCTIIPKRFLKRYKNPCWYSNMSLSARSSSKLKKMLTVHSTDSSTNCLKSLAKEMVSSHKRTTYCLPYFYMPGFPKSGTTSLHQVFKQHPFIAEPENKEPHWWTRIPLGNMEEDYLRVATVRYLQFFSEAKIESDQIIYDGSTSNLWDSNFKIDHQDYCAMPAIVSRITPNAKFVVIMRDPVSRLYSHFYYSCTLHFGHKMSMWPEKMRTDPVGLFHREVVSDTALFTKCLTNYSLYECTNLPGSHSGCGHVGIKLTISIYYVHLRKWMQFFPRKNFLLLKMEDMIAQPAKVMNKVSDFLKIPRMSVKNARMFNMVANKQKISTDSVPTTLEMMPETRKILEDFYKPYTKMLENFYNINYM